MGAYILQGVVLLGVFGWLARWAFGAWRSGRAKGKPIAACLFAAAAIFGLYRTLNGALALLGVVKEPVSVTVERMVSMPDSALEQEYIDAVVSRGAEAVPHLVEALDVRMLFGLENHRPFVALVRIGAPAAEPLIAASRETGGPLGGNAARALARIRDASADPALRARIRDALRPAFPMAVRVDRTESDYDRQSRSATPGTVFQYRVGVVHHLGELKAEPKDPRELVALLAEENHDARGRLVGLVVDAGLRAPEEVVPELETLLRGGEVNVFWAAVKAMREIDPSGARMAPLLAGLLGVDPGAIGGRAELARLALFQMGPEARSAVPVLIEHLGLSEGESWRGAAEILEGLGPLAAEAAGPLEALIRQEREKGEEERNYAKVDAFEKALRGIRGEGGER